MDYDITVIKSLILFGFLGLVLFAIFHNKFNYKELHRLLILGFFFLIITTVLNSLIENNWRLNFIRAFLSLKIVGIWMLRILLSFGYLLIFWGITLFVVFKLRKLRQSN